ncbi:hypothetical protein AMATHDRAFT_60232 [Amanita thiersii Skay4041]|uniref:FK506-binding protein n=1 Tax=Amanita thiersii Skay4041 TaxID=703135 RepID=A0A2A9NT73_9AGAR|nr:hypothetical protein AMATHDRAFT_60232 [Amanita thiersii Skay4041]
MAISIGFWSQVLTPGKEELVVPITDLRVTNVALGDILTDASGRSTIKITYAPAGSFHDEDEDDEDEDLASEKTTTILCSLTAGKFEHTTTDIVLEKDEEYTFQVVGKNTVYLSGNYIDQTAVDNPPFYDSESDSEADYGFGEPDSDIDMEDDGVETDGSRFEEVANEPPKTLKRTREPDATLDTSKAKAKNKKQKGENGKAIPSEPADNVNDGESKKEKKEDKNEGKKVEEKKEKKDDKKKDKAKKPIEKELPGGLKIYDADVGSGPMAKKGNTVQMRYIGKLENGHVFDKNTKGKPFAFRLGQGEVIKGWDEGIVGMQVGGTRRLTIPPSMGYGKKGTEGIPPNSTLIFEVKLIEIK